LNFHVEKVAKSPNYDKKKCRRSTTLSNVSDRIHEVFIIKSLVLIKSGFNKVWLLKMIGGISEIGGRDSSRLSRIPLAMFSFWITVPRDD
jgi:hypothetical protein